MQLFPSFPVSVQDAPLVLHRLSPLVPHRRLVIRFCFLLFSFPLCFFKIGWFKNKRYYLPNFTSCQIHWLPTKPFILSSYFEGDWGPQGYPARLWLSWIQNQIRDLQVQDFHHFTEVSSHSGLQKTSSKRCGWCGGCRFVKKTDSQGSTSCFESESPRMWSGNLYFDKFPRCLPCLWEALNFIPVPCICEREGGVGEREGRGRKKWGESRKGKERR